MTITVEQELQECIRQLSETEKQGVLQMIKAFLQSRGEKERISIEQYNQEIDEALEDIERGETYSHEQVVKMAKDW